MNAGQPVQWNYSFESSGEALANYPGDVNIGGNLNVQGAAGVSPVFTPLPAAVDGVIALAFPATGNIAYFGEITANTVFTVSGGGDTNLQQMTLQIQQNNAGGWGVTLPGAPTVLWPNGTVPSPVATPNALNIFTFTTTGIPGVYSGNY